MDPIDFEISLRPGCASCGGSGVIDTGNNDLPCDCPAGDSARFNTVDQGSVSSEDLKRQQRELARRPLPEYLR